MDRQAGMHVGRQAGRGSQGRRKLRGKDSLEGRQADKEGSLDCREGRAVEQQWRWKPERGGAT